MRNLAWVFLLTVVFAACSPTAAPEVGPVPERTSPPTEPAISQSEPEDLSGADVRVNPRVEDDTDYRIARNLPLDAIPPIYNPEFVPAEQSPLQPDELILGVAWDGEAKAYPITVLRIREMVNDELAGIPMLVTW